jgi:NADPH:quinone reductase
MRAIVVRALGDPSVLKVEELARPVPTDREVLIRVHACGVNFADTERRRGVYATPALPFVPGHEAAGVVEASTNPALLGARVAFWSPTSSGTYAEWATAPADELFVFSDSVPFEVMAALPLQGMTAFGVLGLAGSVHGRTVLVHAAAGGVGQVLVQLARLAGARVLGLASTATKRKALEALDIEAFSSTDDWVAWARGLGGVDVVFDSVGRVTAEGSLAVLKPEGQLLFFGDASGPPAPIDVDALYARSLRVGAFGLDVALRPPHWLGVRAELLGAVERGELRLTVGHTFPLEDAAQAHRALEGRATMGKVVLLPTSG